MSTCRLVDPKDLPCTPCALQQVVPMPEPRTQQLTHCVTYGTSPTTTQHSQATQQTTTYPQSYRNLRTTSRIVARFYASGEPLCDELQTRLRRQCLPAVPCDASRCYATTVAGLHETPGVHCAKYRETTNQAYKPPHQFSTALQMVLQICL